MDKLFTRGRLLRNIIAAAAVTAAAAAHPENQAFAQKANPVEVGGLLSKVPIPVNSSACYQACTKTNSEGTIQIKDNGSDFLTLTDQLMKILTGNGTALLAATTPTASTTPGASDVQLMKLIGDAQMSAGRIHQLIAELSGKMAQLDKSPINAVKIGPNCPEVQQGGYAGPTCECLKAHAIDYATRRVKAEDDYVQQVAALLREYIAKIRTETAIVDNMEQKAKYGEAVNNPAYRQMCVSIQQQALGAIPAVEGMSSSVWGDAANMYANQVNAASGASSGCAAHK